MGVDGLKTLVQIKAKEMITAEEKTSAAAAAPPEQTRLSGYRRALHASALPRGARFFLDGNFIVNAMCVFDAPFFFRPCYGDVHHRMLLVAQWFADTKVPVVWFFDGSHGSMVQQRCFLRRVRL